MPSLTDVAKRAGVSISTASVVLNHGTKKKKVSSELTERVRRVAAEMGYVSNYLAQAMKLGKTGIIGYCMHTGRSYEHLGDRLDSSYQSMLASGIERAIAKSGQSMLIFGSTPEKLATERAILACQQRLIDGIISPMDLLLNTPGFNMDLPAVLIECPRPAPLPVVNWDEMKGLSLAVSHLVELGHRNLAWFGPEPGPRQNAPLAREAGFMQEIWDRGLIGKSIRFERKRPSDQELVDEAMMHIAEACMAKSISSGELEGITALVCYNDLVAAGAYRALLKAGLRIPQDISIVGFDNAHLSRAVHPRLTTLNPCYSIIGAQAVGLLNGLIGNPTSRDPNPPPTLVTPELIIRESTAAPNTA